MIQTNPVFLTANSWNNISLPAPVYLGAGQYWIVELFPGNCGMNYSATGGDFVGVRLCLEQKWPLTYFPHCGDYPHNLILFPNTSAPVPEVSEASLS